MTLAAVVSLSAAAGQLAAAEVEVGVIVVLLNCGTCTIVIPAVSATRGAPTFTRAFLFLGCRILSPRWDAVGCSGARGRALTLTAHTNITTFDRVRKIALSRTVVHFLREVYRIYRLRISCRVGFSTA